MGIIEDLQKAMEKAKGTGTENAKFLVNLLIVSDIPKDGDCVMVKETPGIFNQASMPEIKEPEKKGWEPIERKRNSRATKKKRKYKKRKK